MKISHYFLIMMLFSFLLPVGCSNNRVHSQSTSVVQFLYPDQKEPIESPQIPQLALPLRVGVAFVPSENWDASFTEKEKMELMQTTASHFKKYLFVKSIELIPSTYLKMGGSFTNLEQLRTMFNIDVIALLSYDQTQFTDRGLAAITYWTLVGAYVVRGEKNDTHTMLDAAIYHIASHKMLFRAPGVSHIKSSATPVNLSEQMRKDSLEGLQQASRDLVTNLEIQLQLFQQRVKESPQDFDVIHKPGYTGGGSIDLFFLLIIGFAMGCGLWLTRRL